MIIFQRIRSLNTSIRGDGSCVGRGLRNGILALGDIRASIIITYDDLIMLCLVGASFIVGGRVGEGRERGREGGGEGREGRGEGGERGRERGGEGEGGGGEGWGGGRGEVLLCC